MRRPLSNQKIKFDRSTFIYSPHPPRSNHSHSHSSTIEQTSKSTHTPHAHCLLSCCSFSGAYRSLLHVSEKHTQSHNSTTPIFIVAALTVQYTYRQFNHVLSHRRKIRH
jgi:hypothetical protein